MQALDPSKELRLLLAFFGESKAPLCTSISASRVPEPYRHLLVHDQHMTETLEAYHRSRLRVVPYQVHQQGQLYGRKLDLIAEASGRIVMTGIMLLNFDFCSNEIREAVLAQDRPLGRILVESSTLRQISAESFLRIDASDPSVSRFGLDPPQAAYGRLATIFCDDVPAVDLLEIVNPDS